MRRVLHTVTLAVAFVVVMAIGLAILAMLAMVLLPFLVTAVTV